MSTQHIAEHPEEAFSEKNKKQLVRLLAIILIFAVMNGTMFNVAIPDISETFGLMPSQVSWVMTGYVMVYAIASVVYGKLADIYPLKNILTFGIILFAAGSLLGFFAPNYATLLAARILQAIGGATIPALGFIIPARFFPNERGKVLGIISSTVAFASGVGPIAGGIIGGWLEWRYLFLFPAASVLAIPFFRKWLPTEEVRKGTVDFIGAGLMALAVGSLLTFVTTGQLAFAFIAVVVFPVLLLRIRKAADPFIRPEMLKNRLYFATILTSFFGTSAMFGLIFIIPIMMRDLYQLDTLGIGLVLFPGAMAAGLLGRYGGSLVDRKGSEFVVRLAFTLVAIGLFCISIFAGYTPWLLAVGILIAYLGFPLIQTSTANLLTTLLPEKQTGIGIGLFNLFNFMAGAFSSAIFGAVLDLQTVTLAVNPLAANGEHAIFSNLFFILTLVALAAVTMFTLAFRKLRDQPESEQTHAETAAAASPAKSTS
ncbi:MFS transporter [Salsuginibacillus kocurii]|uniref:MFS transporter n=1 Tax=Salsuginibacillus kocurii TaxID=427078 RepID=UPI000377C202|nr:MFS transporter [Salsuginibacillus kocurii]